MCYLSKFFNRLKTPNSIDSDISELKDLTKECEFEASQLEIVQEVLKDWKHKQTELQDILQVSILQKRIHLGECFAISESLNVPLL